MSRDVVLGGLIPPVISECAVHAKGTTCMQESTAHLIGKSINVQGNPGEIISAAKAKYGCETEKCVLESAVGVLGADRVRREINLWLKPEGPTDSKLLSNVNIDTVMSQWARVYPDFYAWSFNMLNYASYSWKDGYTIHSPDTLATINWYDLYKGAINGRQYRCGACVINSDTYQGNGKHWMALFVDARGSRLTAEFFNSSGNTPAPEWVSWMVKTKNAHQRLLDEGVIKGSPTVEMIRVSNVRHQNSKSECGLYSLFYIWARLNGIPPEFFGSHPIPDKFMFEFRHHLFANDDIGKKFNWDEYKGKTRIEWEK